MSTCNRSSDVAVVIPAYGHEQLTINVVKDLESDTMANCDVYIVDNGGDFPLDVTGAAVLRPGTNLGWAGGCNFGLATTQALGYGAHMLLNNDVSLSQDFVSGMQEAFARTTGGLVGPLYDHNWSHQRSDYLGDARNFRGRATDRRVPFIDGTCMLIGSVALERTGMLDDSYWRRHGWGCDKDYALRVRSWGGTVWVTERSYLNHFARRTAAELPGFSELEAERENDEGMMAKWGPQWQDLLYAGFPLMSRMGMVQARIAREEKDD